MKILLLDHNDSFTYNIVEVLRHFKNCDVSVIKYEDFTLSKVSSFDKIILSPGPGLPKDYPKTIQLISDFHKTKPILGICLGHQTICTFFGANLYNFEKVIHGVSKEITIHSTFKLFQDIPSKIKVGLYHSWAVNKDNLHNDIVITATTKDNIIMSVEHEKHLLFGIQFHPESFLTPHGKQLLKNFIEL